MIDPSRIKGYHAHIYYDALSRPRAAELREAVEKGFTVRMGRWHDVPVGPHPCAMYQVAFENDQFPTLAPFLMMNRMGLTILLPPARRSHHQRCVDGPGSASGDPDPARGFARRLTSWALAASSAVQGRTPGCPRSTTATTCLT
jgi:aromatic ring-cleaving dioxygenase